MVSPPRRPSFRRSFLIAMKLQSFRMPRRLSAVLVSLCVVAALFVLGVQQTSQADSPSDVDASEPPKVEAIDVPAANATTEAEMKPYSEILEHTGVTLDMVPIPGGTFVMGSPDTEAERRDDEGPQHQVEIEPFWMGKYEVTWDQYDAWGEQMDVLRRQALGLDATVRDVEVDGVSRPTEPYTDMAFGMGKGTKPAICMTQHAARSFCKWLSARTGRYYRLPTEAEWEYAARAGTTTAYSFGDDPEQLDDYGWYFDNSDNAYAEVGQKKPNPWGLYDIHGNAAEWVLDQYVSNFYALAGDQVSSNPLSIPVTLYPRVVRGGSWDGDADELRCASREASEEEWKDQDPQEPRSIWYHTDALHVGFRVVRPLRVPTATERAEKWDNTQPEQKDPDEY